MPAASAPAQGLPTSQTVRTSATDSVVTTTYEAANKYVPQTRTVDAAAGQLNLATTSTDDALGNLTAWAGRVGS
ncbi:hypothetical protein GCM10023165_40820 [Variovorax defluvii]|uniref:Uncharacterized protein n=2 Tax=Variovorax defluvii TaxID=913761 RepID=A0ABP8I5W0_9BURK